MEGRAEAPLPYASPMDHIEDAKALVRLWLQRHLLIYSPRYQKVDPSATELYVGEAEVQAFLAGELGAGAELGEGLAALQAMEDRFRAHMSARALRTADLDGSLPLEDLRAAFDVLDPRLFDVLIALLVAEIDPDFLRAYSHAWCDFTRRQPTIGFLLELLARSYEDREHLVTVFTALDHPIFRFGVVEVQGPTKGFDQPRVDRAVRLADRIVSFLCGLREPPEDQVGMRGGLLAAKLDLDAVLLPDEVKQSFLRAFRAGLRGRPEEGVILLHGPGGSGKRSLAAATAAHHDRSVLAAHMADLPADPAGFARKLTAFLREARLQGAVPLILGADLLWTTADDSEERPRGSLLEALATVRRWHRGPLVLTGPQKLPALVATFPRAVQIAVPHPSAEVQRQLWARCLGPGVRFTEGFGIDEVVLRYSLAGGVIESVAQEVRRHEIEDGSAPLTPGDIFPAIRTRLRHRLGALAVPVERGFALDDLVVPKRTREGLQEIVAFVRHRERIVTDWGFGQKASYGRGTSGLFHGPPGTGKTMAASIVGTELGMEVFQIDLSRIVDKYIGETEKNLSRVFDEGSRAQALLLFDEADSLFGKRTSVKTSVDRYANLEVNFLLQMMEAYEGICVLTSNFPEAIDDAFKRRIRFKVVFPFPTAEERVELWRRMMPAAAPLADDVSFEELAARYELTGAYIKNVALRAAAMAAEREHLIDRALLIEAANREYVELGKIVREDR